jgi:hypothetical protein
LLADIRDTFDASDEMASADLVEALVAIEGRPWAEFGRNGKALTQNQLARLLKPLGIVPQKIGPGKRGSTATSAPTSRKPSTAILAQWGFHNRTTGRNAMK